MEFRPQSKGTEAQKSVATDSRKTLIYVLAGVAALLAVILIYILVSKQKLVNELNIEKADLQEQMEALQKDYEGLNSEYETINAQLDSSREEVSQLIERLQKTEATNRSQIRRYQKELGTLRSIMKSYVKQIDSLNTLNHKLTVDAAKARKEAKEARQKNDELQKTVEDLSGKVETGSIIRGRDVKVIALNKNGKTVQRAKDVARLMVSLTLSENSLAPTGPVRIYVIVKDADGNLLSNGEDRLCNGQVTSASREVDYQGNDLDLSIYLNNVASFDKGFYTVEVLSERAAIGKAELMLR